MKLPYSFLLCATAPIKWGTVSLVQAWTTTRISTVKKTKTMSKSKNDVAHSQHSYHSLAAIPTPTTSLSSTSSVIKPLLSSQRLHTSKKSNIMVSSSVSSYAEPALLSRRRRTWSPTLEDDLDDDDEEEDGTTTTTTTASSYYPSSGRIIVNSGLSRAEEIENSFHIRRYQAVVRLRDQLRLEKKKQQQQLQHLPHQEGQRGNASIQITEREWAKACGMTVLELRKVMQQGATAREMTVAANIGLVTSIAKKHYQAMFGGLGQRSTVRSRSGTSALTANGGSASTSSNTILTLQDMIQEGNIGLLKAAERFQPEKGFRFSTYATWWIRQRIQRCISDSSRIIRLPAHVHSTLHRIYKVRKELTARIGREPSVPELAHELEMSVEKLQKYADSSKQVLSLEVPLRSSSGSSSKIDRRTLGDVLASDTPTPEEDAQANYLKRDIQTVMENELAERERLVIAVRFGFVQDGKPRTVEETAKILGITRDRVRLVEARALNKLRSPQRNYRLKEYVVSSSSSSTSSSSYSSSSSSSAETYSHSSSFPLTTPRTGTDTSSRGASERLWFF